MANDSNFDFGSAVLPDEVTTGFNANTADLGGDAFSTGGFTEPPQTSEQSFLDVVDRSIGTFKSKAGTGIMKTAKFLDDQTLIPEEFSRMGQQLEETIGGDEVGDAVLKAGESAIKRAVFPSFPGQISEEMVDEPIRTAIKAAAGYGMFKAPAIVSQAINAVKTNPMLAAKWAKEIGVSTAVFKVAEKMFPDHKNVGQLTGILTGIPAGMMAGGSFGGAKQFLGKMWQGAGKENIKQALKKNVINMGDDFGKALDNGVNTLRAGYNAVSAKNAGTVTAATTDDILGAAGLGARKQMKIIMNDILRVGKKTQGKLLDVNGNVVKRKLSVPEVKDMWFNVKDAISGAKPGTERTSLIQLENYLKNTWVKALPRAEQKTIQGLDDAWGVVKPRTDAIKSAMGITKKHPGVNTDKFGKILSDKGDLTTKGLLDDMIAVDETLGPLTNSFLKGLTKYDKLISGPSKVPIQLGLVSTPISLFLRMGQEAFLGTKSVGKKFINAATFKAVSKVLK